MRTSHKSIKEIIPFSWFHWFSCRKDRHYFPYHQTLWAQKRATAVALENNKNLKIINLKSFSFNYERNKKRRLAAGRNNIIKQTKYPKIYIT